MKHYRHRNSELLRNRLFEILFFLYCLSSSSLSIIPNVMYPEKLCFPDLKEILYSANVSISIVKSRRKCHEVKINICYYQKVNSLYVHIVEMWRSTYH